jgi:hypothetical protein
MFIIPFINQGQNSFVLLKVYESNAKNFPLRTVTHLIGRVFIDELMAREYYTKLSETRRIIELLVFIYPLQINIACRTITQLIILIDKILPSEFRTKIKRNPQPVIRLFKRTALLCKRYIEVSYFNVIITFSLCIYFVQTRPRGPVHHFVCGHNMLLRIVVNAVSVLVLHKSHYQQFVYINN